MIKLTKDTLVAVSFSLATVLLLSTALAGAAALSTPDSSSAPPSETTVGRADTVPLPGEGRSPTVVYIDPATDPAVKIAVQACAGLCNRWVRPRGRLA